MTQEDIKMPWYSQTFPRGSSHGHTIVIFAKYYNLTSTLDLVHGIRNQVLAVYLAKREPTSRLLLSKSSAIEAPSVTLQYIS